LKHIIAFVVTELETGGAENNLTRLAIGLHEHGHDVTVISIASLIDTSPNGPVTKLKAAGVDVLTLRCDSKWQFLRARRKLRDVLAKTKPDFVHSYLFHAHVVASRVCWSTGIPHIIGLRVAEPRILRQRLLQRAIRRAAQIIAVSSDVKDWAKSKFAVAPNRLMHVPNSIEMVTFTNAPYTNMPTKGEHKWITFVGRLHPQKGLLESSAVMRQILANDSTVKLLLVGDGPLRDKLQSVYFTELQNNQVYITGRRDDVPGLLGTSDLFIMPSLWEGMPNALMEAMASGLPVVAFDTHGVAELLGQEQPLQCVEAKNYQQFKHSIETLLSDPSLRVSLGNKNRERMQDHFSLSRHVSEHESIYTRLLD